MSLMRCYRRRGFGRNKGSLQYQVFLRMHPNLFMDEVGIEIVGQRDVGNRGVILRTFRNDLGLEGFGTGTTFLGYGRPLK
jgi:hypothetical protein